MTYRDGRQVCLSGQRPKDAGTPGGMATKDGRDGRRDLEIDDGFKGGAVPTMVY